MKRAASGGRLASQSSLSVAVSAARAAQAPGLAESPNDLSVVVGKSALVSSDQPVERVSVGFGDIAEALAIGPREILVNGKAPGSTSMIVWQQGGGKLFLDVGPAQSLL